MEEINNNKEKFNVYWFDNNRNKCVLKGKSVHLLKKEVEKRDGLFCYICMKECKNLGSLELEHRIPVEIGGKIFCLTNLKLVCYGCHIKKTLIDKKVIKIIKDSGIIMKGSKNSFYKLEDVRNIYLYWFKIIKECKEKYEKWYYGSPNEDYVEVNDLSNREVLE